MTIFPPYLKKGSTVGIVAPAGFMPLEKMQNCLQTLEDWGYNIVLGATAQSHSQNYFSGTDEERRNDLQQMLDDKGIDAILCARGGYGLSRIVDSLKFKKFRKHPKWLVGFSDVTALHTHVFSRYSIASLHAPMAAAFNDGGYNSMYIRSVKEALEGKEAYYTSPPYSYNKTGTATATLIGGNLTLLAHLIGTRSDYKTKGKLLFLEDVGEYLYNIDRMLLQLKRSGKLNKLAGLIIGGFTDVKDTERPFGKAVYEIISDQVADYDYPVCFGFPVSHEKENVALKVGGTYTLQVQKESVTLQEKLLK